MDKQEAIRILDDGKWWNFLWGDIPGKAESKLYEAIDIALAALRAQEETEKNEPLTLDELRQMDGEPVWLETGEVSIDEQIVGRWDIIHSVSDTYMVLMGGGNGFRLDNYGKTWIAYRHRPKEDTENG